MFKRNEMCLLEIVRVLTKQLVARCTVPLSSFYLSLLFMAPYPFYAQLSAQNPIIEQQASTFIEHSIESSSLISDSLFYVVTFNEPTAAKKYLENKTLILRYVGHRTIITQGVHVKNLSKTALIHKANDLWKLSDLLRFYDSTNDHAQTYTLKLRYALHGSELKSILGHIKISHVRNTTVLVQCSYEDVLTHILPLTAVKYIGLESRTAKPESKVLDLNLAPNNISFVQHQWPSLKGQGLKVSIKEDAFDTTDIDLEGRYISSNLISPVRDIHATEMATIVGGEGNSFITGKGVAPEVMLTSSSFAVLEPDPLEAYSTMGISVQNHSYGTQIENFYGSLAEDFDQSVYSLPTLVHVFSSGNDGAATSTNGPYTGIGNYANLTGNFKMSKNTLSVGSVDTVGRTISFSSRGPAYDGRIKPELVAYSMAGSSNSAALVSGVAALIQQSYRDRFGIVPEASLVKALLINGAQDAGPAGIDFITGYGNVDAWSSLKALNENHFIRGELTGQQQLSFQIEVPADAQNLKATLVWTDVPAAANAASALVNDLDLSMTNSENTIILPWVLNSTAQLSSLQEPAQRGVDHVNNTEQISLANPVAGTYTFNVKAHAISQGAQSFYIVYSWDIKEVFQWLYPTGSDHMPYNGETDSYFQWHSTKSETTGSLEITYDKGLSWNLIKSDVDLLKKLLRWKPPVVYGPAQVRMEVNGSYYYSDVFTLSRPIVPTIGFNCQDSVMLNWRTIAAAQSYKVRNYANSSMEDFVITTDTSLIVTKADLQSKLFSVQPILEDAKPGIQGYATDFELQGVTCYLSSFYLELQSNVGIKLNAALGTVYGLSSINFQRLEDDVFVTLALIQNPVSTDLFYLDTSPQQGLNTYRIVLRFINGEIIESDLVSEYFLTDIPFLLFPNPISAGDDLQVIAKQFESTGQNFTLFNPNGAVILTQILNSDRESITIPNLPAGIYLYSIATEEGFTRGKIIIHP